MTIDRQEVGKPSYSQGTGASPLVGLTVGELLDRTTARFSDNPALIVCHQNKRYTYRQFLREVERAARGLLRLGIPKGDRWASGEPTTQNGSSLSLPWPRSGPFW